MTWQAVGTIVALASVAVTLWLNLRSQRLTREGQRQERELADNSASRAEAAARLTEEYTRRVVDALEAIAVTGSSRLGTPPPAKVAWALVHDGGDTYRLTNAGAAEAREINVSAHSSLGGLVGITGGPDLAPGEALTFMAAPDYETSDSTITVKWLQPDGTTASWRYPLPASH